MNIIREENQGIIILHISGYMVADFIGALKEVFEQCLDMEENQIILNLEEVKMIDSSGIGAIVFMTKRCRPAGDIKIASVSKQVMKIFQMVRLDKIIDIYPSVNDALLSMGNRNKKSSFSSFQQRIGCFLSKTFKVEKD